MPTNRSESIRIKGLSEFRRELKALDHRLPIELRKAHKKVADMVTAKTKESFAGRPGIASEVPEGVRSSGTQQGAAVMLNASRAPMIFGSEFGAIQYRQFPAWRGSGPGAGYSLFPTIRNESDHILTIYLDEVGNITRKAFPD